MNSFDKNINKFYCTHVEKVKNKNNILRVVISNTKNINDNKFYFNKSNNLSIISIFE